MPFSLPSTLKRGTQASERAQRIISTITQRGIEVDRHQLELVNILANSLGGQQATAISGVYIYGPPGRGKSMVLDAFCADLAAETTARFHFHDFFRAINSPKAFREGQKIGSIFAEGLARELGDKSVVLFDEFHCVEPGDAMFMARLVAYCQQHGIFLVTTSNYGPEKLLDDDAFHHLILPTITLIRDGFAVFELDAAVDYRTLSTSDTQRSSGYGAGTLNVGKLPEVLPTLDTQIQVGYGEIGPAAVLEQTVFISFEQLCRTRRNTADYLDLASRYSCWHILSVPTSDQMPMDEERRFANLIDVFYDRNIEVHLYTQDQLQHLGQMLHEIEHARLTSRIAQLTTTFQTSDRIAR